MNPGGPRSRRARFKVQYSDFSSLYQPQTALTPPRCFSFLKHRQLSEPQPRGPGEAFSNEVIRAILLAGQQGDSHSEHPSKAFEPICPSQPAPSSPAKHPGPLHHSMLETTWHGSFLPCFLPKAPEDWISHQGQETRDFQSFTLLWPK